MYILYIYTYHDHTTRAVESQERILPLVTTQIPKQAEINCAIVLGIHIYIYVDIREMEE